MKYYIVSVVFIVLMSVWATAFAGSPGTIHLKDGSVIAGELVSVGNSSYKISTKSMGVVEIDKQQVRSIDFGAVNTTETTVPSGRSSNDIMSQASSLSKIMMNDKAIMDSIIKLQDNPDFKAAMNDPEIMNAIRSGNIDALLSNPSFIKLMEDSTVKSINRQLSD